MPLQRTFVYTDTKALAELMQDLIGADCWEVVASGNILFSTYELHKRGIHHHSNHPDNVKETLLCGRLSNDARPLLVEKSVSITMFGNREACYHIDRVEHNDKSTWTVDVYCPDDGAEDWISQCEGYDDVYCWNEDRDEGTDEDEGICE